MKILLPVDGSKSALNAAKYVAKLTKQLSSKCTVTLISVHDDIGLGHVKQFVANSVIDDYLREVSEKELKGAQKVLDTAGVKHSMVIKRGNIANEIVARSRLCHDEVVAADDPAKAGDGYLPRHVVDLVGRPLEPTAEAWPS
jgi:hypothetical protein